MRENQINNYVWPGNLPDLNQIVNLWNKLLFSTLVQVHYFPRRNSKHEYQTIVESMPTLHQEDIHLLKEDIPHTK